MSGLLKRAWLGALLLAAALVASVVAAAPASALSRVDVWQSPSGAVKCRMYMNGSLGKYTLACLVTASNKLVRWSGTFPDCSVGTYGPCGGPYRVSTATATQRAQFTGAPRLAYGRTIGMGKPMSYGAYVFWCKVSPTTGTTCWKGPDDPLYINFRSGVVKICAGRTTYGTACRRIL